MKLADLLDTHESIRFLDVHHPEWSHFLNYVAHDVYHLPQYSQVIEISEKVDSIAVYYQDHFLRVLVPLTLRNLPLCVDSSQVFRDAMSPYGFAGPLFNWNKEVDEAARQHSLQNFKKDIIRFLKERCIISLFVRFHPTLSDPRDAKALVGSLSIPTPTVYFDLSNSKEQLWMNMSKQHRWAIRRLRRMGFTARRSSWDRLAEFVRMYYITMERVSPIKYYIFPFSYFKLIKEKLPYNAHLFFVFDSNESPAAAAICFECNGIVQVHLAATAEQHRLLAPSKLLISELATWAKDRGNHTLHIGGGVGGHDDSLFKFKSRFSSNRGKFFTWRTIVKPTAYNRLMAQSSKWCAVDDGSKSFFPAYRRPALCEANVDKTEELCENCSQKFWE